MKAKDAKNPVKKSTKNVENFLCFIAIKVEKVLANNAIRIARTMASNSIMIIKLLTVILFYMLMK